MDSLTRLVAYVNGGAKIYFCGSVMLSATDRNRICDLQIIGRKVAGNSLGCVMAPRWLQGCPRLVAEAARLPDTGQPFCNALMNRAAALHHAGRGDEALELWGDVVERFGGDDRPGLLAMVANAQKNRGALLEQTGRYEEALAVWQQVEDRFGRGVARGHFDGLAWAGRMAAWR